MREINITVPLVMSMDDIEKSEILGPQFSSEFLTSRGKFRAVFDFMYNVDTKEKYALLRELRRVELEQGS